MISSRIITRESMSSSASLILIVSRVCQKFPIEGDDRRVAISLESREWLVACDRHVAPAAACSLPSKILRLFRASFPDQDRAEYAIRGAGNTKTGRALPVARLSVPRP